MSVLSKLDTRAGLSAASVQMLCLSAALRAASALWQQHKRSIATTAAAASNNTTTRDDGAVARAHAQVHFGVTFWRRLLLVLRLCLPRVLSVEVFDVVLMLVLLLLRTRLALLTADLVGKTARHFLARDRDAFVRSLINYALLFVPNAALQVAVQYLKVMLEVRLRNNLQSALEQRYLRDGALYRIAVDGTVRSLCVEDKHHNDHDHNEDNNHDDDKEDVIDNIDHRMTHEVRQLTMHLTDLFRNALKPLIDVVIYTVVLARAGGVAPLCFFYSYYLLAGTVSSTCLPSLAPLLAVAQEREGNMRTMHSQLVEHAEEVAFYGGEALERAHAAQLMQAIVRHEQRIKAVKWCTEVLDSLLFKYGAVCCGYIVCGAAAYALRSRKMSTEQLTEVYFRNTHLYVPLSTALSQVLLLHKKLSALCSSTHRVGAVCEALALCNKMSGQAGALAAPSRITRSGDAIVLSHVDVTVPGSDVRLIADLTLRIVRGTHVLIMGSNGTGKTTLAHTLAGLHAPAAGTITLPADGDNGARGVFILPQRVYLPGGTLRAQMLYPAYCDDDNKDGREAAARVCDDATLLSYMEQVGLTTMLAREGGLDVCKSWGDVLSGGERQRLALVRVLVHRPAFAVLDECTSAVAHTDEVELYATLQRAGVTLVTISHREALRQLHHVLVELDGEGHYRVTQLT